MKKLFIILFTFLILTACEQVTNVIEEIEGWFVRIESSASKGTMETEFRFQANTNDTIKGWFIDREYTENSSVQNLAQFNTIGTHTVEIITENDAYDIVSIEIYETPEEIPDYTIIKYYLDWREIEVTDLLYVYDEYVQVNGVNLFYDGFDVFYDGSTKYIKVPLIVCYYDTWLFKIDRINNKSNFENRIGIDPWNMTIEDFKIAADVIRRYPEETIWDLMDEYNP